VKPEFLTNRPGESVAEALAGYFDHLLDARVKPFELSIASAYVNPGGFGLLADQLERVPSVRLLLGAEPDSGAPRPRALRGGATQGAQAARLRNALEGHRDDLARDRDLLGFEVETDAQAQRLVRWLRSGRVEVKRYEQGFLHGKAYLVATDDEGVVAGSSNFTYAGLAKNQELNLGRYEPGVVSRVREWFDELWGEAEPFDLASIYDARYEPHNPYLIYLRMLFERYGAELSEETEEPTCIQLTNFGRHGVWRARRILDKYKGVLVADGVGLGKTFLAGELICQAVRQQRQRVLLIAPASLRDGMWRKFLLRHQLGVECVSFEELSDDKRLNPAARKPRLQFAINDYAMVVIDESHGYRNPETERAAVLRQLLKGLPPKELVLLTATPVNNSLWDLYYLLTYFIKNDAAFADAGTRSLRNHFAEAMAQDPETLTPERLFDVLDAVAVRRTRHFVKRYYPNDTIRVDGVEVPIQFPKPTVHRVDYSLEELLPGFFPCLAHALDCEDPVCPKPERREEHPGAVGKPVLTLARYGPTRFLKDVDRLKEAENEQGMEVRRRLAAEAPLSGLLRSGLLKRFESSAYAFALTCRRMAHSHDVFLKFLQSGKVATGEVLTEWMHGDAEDLEAFLDDHRNLNDARDYEVASLRAAVQADRYLLLTFAAEAERVTPEADPKLAALREALGEIAGQAAEEDIPELARDKRKVIVFSYYADTAKWIYDHLGVVLADPGLAVYRARATRVSGNEGDKSDALFGFAPISAEAPDGTEDRYDLLVTTDVLAEGVNLQQAQHIINYDLPWNPMRMVQRHGRIDRIGSKHDRVYIRCFFPTTELDSVLKLEQRLQGKITTAAHSIGVEGEILPGSKTAEVVFAETREEIERLHREEAGLFEAAGEKGNAYSGEEYRQELRQALADPKLAADVKALPWGSGSGLIRAGAVAGYVFCARVGDHEAPRYRYVDLAQPEDQRVLRDTLACLAHAHADVDTGRVLSDATHRLAYDAWALARGDILEEWLAGVDPAKLQPAIPKTMRDVVELVRAHPPAGLDQRQVDRLVDVLNSPYGNRILRLFREAMKDADTRPQEAAEAVRQVALDQGLEPAPAPEPLPVISLEDIHLICWQAIVPEDAP
jgi:hypothetical protein